MNQHNDITKAQKSLFVKLLRVLMWLILILLFLIGALVGLLFVYEDEVKAAIIGEINKHLKAEVKIDPENIDLTIVKTFPDCSMQFTDVLMLEALKNKNRDTLIFAGQLNLHFNIKDLWNKKYAIQKLKIRDGVLKPAILPGGKPNYVIWESSAKDTAQTSNVKFDLELLSLKNCKLDYRDQPAGHRVQLQIKELELQGNFNTNNYRLKSEASLAVTKITYKKSVVLKDKTCSFEIALNVSNNQYVFEKADLRLNRLRLDLKGGFTYRDSLENLDLTYNAPGLDIASVLSFMPSGLKNKMNDYESSGSFYVNGRIRYQSPQNYMIESDFGVKNGTVTYKPMSTSVNQVEVEGHLRSGNKVNLLEIRNISLKLKGDELHGSGSISDFSNPYIQFSGKADFDLANLQAFYPIDTLQSLKGALKISLSTQGLLSDLKEKTFSSKVGLDLDAWVKDLEMQFKNDEHLFAIKSGSIIAKDREVEIRDLALSRGQSDVLLNGKLPGLFNYLSEPGSPLIISGNLQSSYIKLEDFMLKYKASGGESSLIPADIVLKLDASIQKFSYSKFTADNIRGQIEVKNQKAIVSDMVLNTMEGTAQIDAFADNSHNKLNVALEGKLSNINVRELFTGFNNFGQSTLVDKNVKGFISADIDFTGSWSNKLDPDLSSIRASCDLNIERGELIDFKPLVSLSKFVDIEDLKHIRFSTLQSEVQIKNKIIHFPKTVLKNSALNIIFSGTHSFDNEIDYHIRLLISELLAKKRKPDNEFGPVEEDKDKRWNAYILMTGTLDNPVKKFDRQGHKEKVREDIREEKQTVKRILKEELGLFKKDDLPPKEKKSEQKFELEKPGNNSPKKTLEPKKKPADEDF